MPANRPYFRSPSEGIPTTKAQSLEPFGAGEPDVLNSERMAQPEALPEVNAALGEFAGIAKSTRSSSIQSHQAVTLPKEGGPDSQRS